MKSIADILLRFGSYAVLPSCRVLREVGSFICKSVASNSGNATRNNGDVD